MALKPAKLKISMIDKSATNDDNSGKFIVISNGDDALFINKRDLVWHRTNHEHHYLPDFTDEWDEAIALKCAKPGCPAGIMQRKEGEDFMRWLDEHRART